ncbi:hypothetical protein [Cupriavidus pinatubonensis]|uniref:Uncharacterized protein n=1 Tax=Cupriavidus pinatubonensis TaxID=248026 RepID=A0ABM8Y416_9BURK|nr:hypothetical protein [Cupriavidus pinatubonensis]CAG9187516.1 hypothetical protein LMG23994_06961 [Cupriavidus pinatubonensis]
MDFLEQVVSDRLTRHARWLGVQPPYDGSEFIWKDEHFYHLSGIDRQGRRVLIEVFRIGIEGKLEAVFAFQYPPPIRNLYRAEYDLLYSDDS